MINRIWTFHLAQEWLAHMLQVRYSNRTIEAYPVHVEAFFLFANVVPEEAKRVHVVDWIGSMTVSGLAPRTIHARVAAVASYFDWRHYRDEAFTVNPTKGVILPAIPERLPDHMTMEAVSAILTYEPKTFQLRRATTLCELLYSNGPRISEVVAMNQADVDTESGRVTVIGKGDKARVFVLNEAAKRRLAAWKAAYPKAEDTPLFFNRAGGRMSASGLRLDVKALARQVGVPRRVYPHLMRATIATHLLDAGAPLSSIQDMLGHTSPATTRIYAAGTTKQQAALMAFHPRHL